MLKLKERLRKVETNKLRSEILPRRDKALIPMFGPQTIGITDVRAIASRLKEMARRLYEAQESISINWQ